jgi:hypothetical protein
MTCWRQLRDRHEAGGLAGAGIGDFLDTGTGMPFPEARP